MMMYDMNGWWGFSFKYKLIDWLKLFVSEKMWLKIGFGGLDIDIDVDVIDIDIGIDNNDWMIE